MNEPLRLLLLEDTAVDADLNERALRKAGIELTSLRVDTLADFAAALDGFKPDVILADYRLPDCDGLQALAVAREKTPDTPYLFVTGTMGEELAADSIRQGATDYVLKDRLARLPVALRRALAEKAEQARRRTSDTRFRVFFDHAMVGMATTLPDKGWITANPALCEMLGYRLEELLTKTWAELTHPDDLAASNAGYARMLAGEIDGYSTEKRYLRKDGSLLYAFVAGRAVRRADGSIDFFAVTVEDISERVHSEQTIRDNLTALRATNRQLEDAQGQLLQSEKLAALGQLAAGVAHEINNPVGFVSSNLGSLDGYLEEIFAVVDAYESVERNCAANCPEFDPVRRRRAEHDFDYIRKDIVDLLRESKDGLARVRKIVQDLKDFSRVGEQEWQWSELHQCLDSTLNIVWNEIKYKTQLVKTYADDLPPIYCLPSQINQVFMNLLVNAAQAIEVRGAITLRSGRAGDEVWVEVEDTGKGIEPEHLTRIFEPFFTTKPVGQGTGLGLSLVHGIVRRHRGRIEVRSEVGSGSTFRIVLPIAGPAADEPTAAVNGPAA